MDVAAKKIFVYNTKNVELFVWCPSRRWYTEKNAEIS